MFIICRYRRKVSSVKPITSKTLKILDMTSDFLNQTYVKEEVNYNKVADWQDFMLSNINRNIVDLVTESANHSEMVAEKLVSTRKFDEIVPVIPKDNSKSRSSGKL